MKLFVICLLLTVSMTHGNPHHEPRHEGTHEDHHETEAEKVTEEENDHSDVRHHIYMPYPLAYRQSAHPPEFQYVPIYPQEPQEPRFISYNRAVYGNLGFISGGYNYGFDASKFFQGKPIKASYGAGIGLGPQYAQYGQFGVTSLKPTKATYRTVPAPMQPDVAPIPVENEPRLVYVPASHFQTAPRYELPGPVFYPMYF